MSNLYINGRFLIQKVTGVQRVGIETIKELQKNKSIFSITILIPFDVSEKTKKELPNVKFKVINLPIKVKGHLWEQIVLPLYIKTKGVNLINFCNTAPIILKQQIVYLHDAAIYDVPKGYNLRFILWYKFLYYFLKKENYIVTVSEFSKERISFNLNLPKNKITRIYNGVDHYKRMDEASENKEILNRLKVTENDYFLTVGSKNPNKNQIMVEQLAELNPLKKFVIVGENSNTFRKSKINQLENCIYTGYLDERDLKTLYKYSKCFIFPSLYEGFGIPPFEALAYGTPVLTSDRGSLKELLAEYTIMFDPYDLKKINEILNSKKTFEKLFVKTINYSNDFNKLTWENASKQLIELLVDVRRKKK